MPQRPHQHELDTEAVDFINSKLPARWTKEEIERDYGKDLYVEIFENGEATALGFWIQSKGHKDFVVRHGNKIIQELKASTLNYYDRSPLPILLIVYSARLKQARYLWIKSYIHQVLDKERPKWRRLKGESKISIQVPFNNIFDETSHTEIFDYVESELSKILGLNSLDTPLVGNRRLVLRGFTTSTRLIRPKISAHLHRSRLTSVIASELNQKGVFIRADAGFGKTWLIQDYLDTAKPSISVWYTFTKDSLDSLTFLEELASELFRKTESIGLSTLQLIVDKRKEIRPDNLFAVLVDEISSSNSQILLIMEDLHNIVDNTIYSVILSFLKIRPNNLQIVLTSRLPLPSEQSKLIAQGYLRVVERFDLEFNLDEINDYLKLIKGLDLSAGQIDLLHKRTGGWVAAVSLALNVLERNPDLKEDLFTRLTGFAGNIYDFFAEEVYQALTNEFKSLLKRLSVVRSIDANLVNLFTGRTDGGQVLKDLVAHNTFLVEDQNTNELFRLHTLFAEFLLTRFRDEEGVEAIKETHSVLAKYYSQNRDWYPAIESALVAEEFEIAIQCLETIGSTGLSLGHGQILFEWIEKIPEEKRDSSALLSELIGIAALQVGKLDIAAQELIRAQNLFGLKNDKNALNQIEYFLAETHLATRTITPEEFVSIVKKVTLQSYQTNEILFGVQVELRLIEVGQTISTKYSNVLPELVDMSEALLEKVEPLGSDYEFIKSRVLSSQAHLAFQMVTDVYRIGGSKVQIREKIGHPVPMEERIVAVRQIIDGFDAVFDLYRKAEELVKDKNEIEWATIHMDHLSDFVHYISLIFIFKSVDSLESVSQAIQKDEHTKQLFYLVLMDFDKCAAIFGKYHLMQSLANLFSAGSEIYDILGDIENRDRLAGEALGIATTYGFSEIIQRTQKVLQNQNTFNSLFGEPGKIAKDEYLSSLDEDAKTHYANSVIQSLGDNVDIESKREAIVSDVNDMVSSAKQRIGWCKHVQIIQDLGHTKSLETMYKQIPPKWIVCEVFGYRSPESGPSFDQLWPLFKGVHCLSCIKREL